MKKSAFVILFLFLSVFTYAQSSSSIVKWDFSIKETGDKKLLECKASIRDKWHLYSQHIKGDGPIPTSFTFTDSENFSLIGAVNEEKAHTAYDPNFDMEISYFEGATVFIQEIKNNTKNKVSVSGSVEFMVCDDHMCYPPEIIEFTVELP